MAKKAPAAVPSTTTTSVAGSGTSVGAAAPAKVPGTMKARWNGVLSSVGQTVTTVVKNYKATPQRTKLLDAFLAFIAVVGAIQFVYCVLVGNFPFNAFLSGFSATVGQFVLTVSLRIQTTEANKAEFPSISPERAFGDYVVGSLILHFFCINFIN
ncbi:oligosaccharyltransferase complex subunit epsilon [Diatrype stigma]|uniref:Dolichyl-diphosphooligosaccharide--protein glycosyltransferase subunit OST2 n=1 Tax=Diatrype stigma TaxID=117547 RepID=A0AAN9YJ65_9PEZI